MPNSLAVNQRVDLCYVPSFDIAIAQSPLPSRDQFGYTCFSVNPFWPFSLGKQLSSYQLCLVTSNQPPARQVLAHFRSALRFRLLYNLGDLLGKHLVRIPDHM